MSNFKANSLPGWSSSLAPGRRQLMPANLLKTRSPKGGSSNSGRHTSKVTEMPAVSSRRVVSARGADLLPTQGLPHHIGGLHQNGAGGSNINTGTRHQHPLASHTSAHGASSRRRMVSNGAGRGLFPTFPSSSGNDPATRNSGASGGGGGSGVGSSSGSGSDAIHPSSSVGLAPSHAGATSSHAGSAASSPGSARVPHQNRVERHIAEQQQQHNYSTHRQLRAPSQRNLDEHQSEDQKQQGSDVAPIKTAERILVVESSASPTPSRKLAPPSSSSKRLREDAPRSALHGREVAMAPRDPRVKLDPKLTMLNSHSHVAANISGDNRVQLRIAVEELRLIVKWREQQQQELQKRIGKLAGKYNKLLDLYISEKDRAETAFARLQKQLRELRHRDQESTKKLEAASVNASKQTAEVERLKSSLDQQKSRHESETTKLEGHVDVLNSRLRALKKEKSNKTNGAEEAIQSMADLALCRWPVYNRSDSVNHGSGLLDSVGGYRNQRSGEGSGSSIGASNGSGQSGLGSRRNSSKRKQTRQPVRPSKSGIRSFNGRNKVRARSRMSQSNDDDSEDTGEEDRAASMDDLDRQTNTTVSSEEDDENDGDDGDDDGDDDDDDEEEAEKHTDEDDDEDDDNDLQTGRRSRRVHAAVDGGGVRMDATKGGGKNHQHALSYEKAAAQSHNNKNDNNNHDRTDSEKLTSKALLDEAARELELVKIELGWKEKRMSAMKSRLDQLQRQKEREDGSARVGAFKDAMLCEVCRNAYQSPVLLIPCGHSFCSGCLDTSGGAEEMKCFECQSDVTGWVENHGLAVACECANSVQERWN